MNLFRDISPERRYLFFCHPIGTNPTERVMIVSNARNVAYFAYLLHNRVPTCFICNERIYHRNS
jgi:hypothetical protein